MKKLIIQIVLIAISAVLIYMVYQSIMEPVKYENQKETRKEVIVQKLNNIKALQVEFKKINGYYCTSFDTLKAFYETGKIPFVLKIGSNDTLTEATALKLKLIRRDTSYIAVKDSLFKDVDKFNINTIDIVPFTDGQVKFKMETSTILKSGFSLPVIEVSCLMEDYLKNIKEKDLLKNEIQILIDDEKFPGLKLGSLLEVSLDGNWQ